MSARRYLWTAVGAISVAALGFVAGAAGSAMYARDLRAQPWRSLRVEHQGGEGATTHTRIIFESGKLPLTAIEVTRSPEGAPEIAHVELAGGVELTARYEEDHRPASLQGPDGGRAVFVYKGAKVRVDFVAPDGSDAGSKVVSVPVELLSALRVASVAPNADHALGALWDEVAGALEGDAWAVEKDEEDESITVQREVELSLDIRVAADKGDAAGTAQVEATCPPFACLPLNSDAKMPGQSKVRIAVSGNTKKGALKAPKNTALEPFKRAAGDERGNAARVLPNVTTLVAVVAVTELACKSLKLTWPICVAGMSKSAAGAAIQAISSYEVKTEGREVDKRAIELYYEDEARAVLDQKTRIEVCVSRDGFSRTCTDLQGRPFAADPMPPAKASIELRRGIGGALAGSHELTQSDGADCKFSPSPRTRGTLKMSFDNETGVVTGSLKAEERGTRAARCSQGSASMHWNQSYTISVSQTFKPEQLLSGGKLSIRLTGTMQGTGGYNFTACVAGGGNVNCPAGKNDSYSYPVELLGEIDLDSQTGSGRIAVTQTPLATRGTWQIPAAP